ncbi:MAG: hypothetical protein ACTSYI_02470, partial [Promethearchaeota archaeon]
MEKSKVKKQILSVIIIAFILCEIAPQVSAIGTNISAVETSESAVARRELKLDWTYVFYDPTDEDMEYLGESVFEILNYRIYNIQLIPVYDLSTIEKKLDDQPWIAIYAFKANLTGMFIQDSFIEWSDYYGILATHQETQHIVGTGNTLSLEEALPDKDGADFIYHSQADQIDLLLLILYDVWTVSELANQRALIEPEYNSTAVDLTLMATKLYADNINAFLQVQFEPTNPIGQINEVERELARDDMYERNAAWVEPAYYHKEEDGTLTKLDESEIDESFQPTMQLSPLSEVGPDDFILGDIPLLSGLQGPIGEIIDVLLPLLSGDSGGALSIPNGIMDLIQGSFGEIGDIIGLVTDFSAESALKILLDILSNEFPFIEDLKPFIEIFTKALFNLRGGLDDISGIIFELIEALMEKVLPESVGDVVGTVLNVGEDLWTEIEAVTNDGKSIFDAMVGFFSGNVMKGLLNKTLVSSLSVDQSAATEIVDKFIPFIKTTVSFLVSFDLDSLIDAITGPVLTAALGALDSMQQEGMDKVGKMIKLAFKVVDLADGFSTESVIDVLKEAILIFIDSADIQEDVEKLAQKIMKIVQNFKEGHFSSIPDFKDHVITQLGESLSSSVSTEVKALFADVMAMICGIYNDGFDPAELPNIFDLAEGIIDQVGMDATTAASIKGAITNLVKPIMGLIGHLTGSDGLKQMLPADLFSTSNLMELIPDMIKTVLGYLDTGDVLDGLPDFDTIMNTFGQLTSGIMSVVDAVKGKSFSGVLKALWMSVGTVITLIPPFDNVPIDAVFKLLQSFFPEQFGLSLDNLPKPTDVIEEIMDIASSFVDSGTEAIMRDFLKLAMDLKGLFTEGIDWIVGKILDWAGGLLEPLLDKMETELQSILGDSGDMLGYHGKIPIGLGDWSLFVLNVDLGIQANFNINPTPLLELVKSMILDARSTFSLDNVDEFFKVIFSMFEISPQFYAELGVDGLDTEKNSFMKYL